MRAQIYMLSFFFYYCVVLQKISAQTLPFCLKNAFIFERADNPRGGGKEVERRSDFWKNKETNGKLTSILQIPVIYPLVTGRCGKGRGEGQEIGKGK